MDKQHQKNNLVLKLALKITTNFNEAYHSFSNIFSRHFINTF